MPASQQAEELRKSYQPSFFFFSVTALEYLHDNIWIKGKSYSVNPIQPASSLVEAEKFT